MKPNRHALEAEIIIRLGRLAILINFFFVGDIKNRQKRTRDYNKQIRNKNNVQQNKDK